jgi:hypothetical protein
VEHCGPRRMVAQWDGGTAASARVVGLSCGAFTTAVRATRRCRYTSPHDLIVSSENITAFEAPCLGWLIAVLLTAGNHGWR